MGSDGSDEQCDRGFMGSPLDCGLRGMKILYSTALQKDSLEVPVNYRKGRARKSFGSSLAACRASGPAGPQCVARKRYLQMASEISPLRSPLPSGCVYLLILVDCSPLAWLMARFFRVSRRKCYSVHRTCLFRTGASGVFVPSAVCESVVPCNGSGSVGFQVGEVGRKRPECKEI